MKINFKSKVRKLLQKQGFTVTNTNLFGIDLISTNPVGRAAGILIKPHGHLTKLEKQKLLVHHMPIYIARETYSGDSSLHAIKVERIKY